MSASPDVIVAGLGAVGSAALYQLARRGVRALGIDRFQPPHQYGSSHGDSRITRMAIGEGAVYVQFVRRAHAIWRELEGATDRTLLRTVGCLIYGTSAAPSAAHGAPDFLQATIDVAEHYGIAHERLDATALRQRFPQFRWHGDEHGCFEPGGGFVHPEACISAQLETALRLGAQVQTGERVERWSTTGGGIAVETDRATYTASRLIIAAGAWLPALVPVLAPYARAYRQVMFWFSPHDESVRFDPAAMPVYVRLPDQRTRMFYGFPAVDGPRGGLKIAAEQFDRAHAPDDIEREVRDDERAAMYAVAAPHLRIAPRCLRAAACAYTVTPDFHFVIDHAPDSARVWFASACSGHGFKHSAAVGEALAQISVDGRTSFDLSPFRLNRFAISDVHGDHRT
jgi:sarcosine oxidase